jgi:4-amino-4-deoxy-L-arabinose transferase-like glycosyltransferase
MLDTERYSLMKKTKRAIKAPSRITILLAVFVGLATLYSVVVPPFEASDELWHYPMVKYIADNWALPVQDPENVGPWRQEGSQPPLYYWIGAAATFWIDTSDMNVVRHLNPHADNGIATPDGNVNLITHHPSAEAFPWKGTTLAVHLIRFLSVLMGAATVYLTYRLSLELLPGRPNLALMAAAVNGFTPMFVFISGAINNDNLVIPLCSLALLLLVRLVKSSPSPTLRNAQQLVRFLPLGVVVGLALLTKESAGGLILLTGLAVIYVAWRERSAWTFVMGGLTTGGAAVVIAGWWYLRNWQLYGDPTGQNVFIQVLGQRDVPANLAQLWRERISFFRGYWGNFGGLNVPMAEGVYVALDVLLVLAMVGLVLGSLLRLRALVRDRSATSKPARRQAGLVAWLLVLAWPVLVAGLWVTWATTTWSSQGRLIFSAISVLSLLLMLGWHYLARVLPRRLGATALAIIPLFMFGISLVAPFAWIRPAYAPPAALSDEQVAAIPRRVDAIFFHPAGGQLKLLGYDAPIETAYPGEPVPVTLYWETIEPFGNDYSIFLHLVDAHDLVVAQRDARPGMGILNTAWLKPGQRWAEERIISLPNTAFSPNETVFEAGLYDYQTGERLAAVRREGEISGDQVRFGQLTVQARPGTVPNPIRVDFGGEMELIGYDLDKRALRPGESAVLTLYWRAQRTMAENYSISAQFVDDNGVKAAQKDAWPLDGAAPTSVWQPGNVVVEPRPLQVFEGTPPGTYDVYIAVYPSTAPEALLVVTPPGGRLQTDHIVLTTIRVLAE